MHSFADGAVLDGTRFKTVAMSLKPADGEAVGVVYGGFNEPVINNLGQIAFRGALLGPGITASNNIAVFTDAQPNGLGAIAHEGLPALGGAGSLVYEDFTRPKINNSGQVVFGATLREPGEVAISKSELWSHANNGTREIIARSDDPAAGISAGATFADVGDPGNYLGLNFRLNDEGKVLFYAGVQGPGIGAENDRGLWLWQSGPPVYVAAEGNAAPGLAGGVYGNGFMGYSINDDGVLAWSSAVVNKSGITGGVWTGTPDAPNLKLSTGSLGTKLDGQTLRRLSSPTRVEINDLGDIAFNYDGPDFATDRRGVVVRHDDSIDFVSGIGAPAPAEASATVWGLALSAAGEAVMHSGNNLFAVDAQGGVSLLASYRGPAPGLPASIVFYDPGPGLVMNNAGQVAFVSTLIPANGFQGIGNGLWAQTIDGDLVLIARTGDVIDVDDGPLTDLRTIDTITLQNSEFLGLAVASNQGGESTGFNDLGQLAFRIEFTDGTQGVFMTDLVATPEPSTWVLASCGAFAIGYGRRRFECCGGHVTKT